MESDKKPSGFAGRGCEGSPALVFCHEGCVNPRLIFLTPQSHASPTPGGEEGGMSVKGLKAIVRAMRNDKRERMPRLLPQAMAEELPPEGDDKRPAGEGSASAAPGRLSRSARPPGCRVDRQAVGLASARSQRWAWRRTRGSRPRDRGHRPTSRCATHSAPEAFLARFRDMSTRRLHGYLA